MTKILVPAGENICVKKAQLKIGVLTILLHLQVSRQISIVTLSGYNSSSVHENLVVDGSSQKNVLPLPLLSFLPSPLLLLLLPLPLCSLLLA